MVKLWDVQRQADQFVETILNLPCEWRAGWLVYILEALDTEDAETPAMLEEVRDSINVRMAEGTW